ncbi:Uncharacterised protein [Vibrio cholerae]|uniref:Uncharacterized protein n=1 Tax=Vibrio cholerae TaxID=666 RepID=A0A655SWP4_VIBCL|nr:Uncharacterised protein [Vibrio cholerae]CSB27938.1 Uncharacterised protein [Vibrio cholerae]CSC61164.1 Uncharacterised protein [Vibrio cholerae]CSD19341.1 Uncharacterised protein [Vibrio cholerae]
MIRANSTTILTVRPKTASTNNPVKKDPGIETPTNSEVRTPRIAMITTTTRMMADRILFCRSLSMSLTSSDSSQIVFTNKLLGQSSRA